ncbi:CDK-activating kinase assembly factor [Rickenella mellea]|uniref:RNA polymerase II transcription factor B subunit 3 n=1 Tax=Rickenella mellea TaxID=50990 RepID=A0A4Y7QK32_9AGAM|nr:CDK-activating kinase assembly factor [Rickenella mellea]
MSKSGWLRGTTVRKGLGSSQNTRASTPQVQSTSTTIFGGGVKDATGKVSEYSSMEDQCPVCKSDRYLNPKLRLLVSACYHKMCESCIDRLFTLGPAPCPICGKTLRKLAFMPQTFEDLFVEKEVAVRRRLAKEFNKRREDFTDLRAYNDYLEQVEDIMFNLINDIDVAKTEDRIKQYRIENAALIEANIQKDESYAAQLREQEETERSTRAERARELEKEEDEERRAREAVERELLNNLEHSSTDALKLVAKSRAELAKREQARKASAGAAQSRAGVLRSRAVMSAIPDEPHVPLQDNWYAYEDKFVLKDDYFDPLSEAVKKDREGIMRAGGYRVEEAWERAIRCAVAGLDVPPSSELSAVQSVVPHVDLAGDVVMASA